MPPKRKHVVLTIKQKLEIIDKLEKGQSATSLALEYGCGRQTISDFKNNKQKLRDFAQRHLPSDIRSPCSVVKARTMRTAKHEALDAACFKWYNQQKSCGITVRGVDIKDAAKILARDLGIEDFRASEGWLWRFRRRHALGDRRVSGESASAAQHAVAPFRDLITKLIKDEGLVLSQIYNFDETGLFWRALPSNTQASIHCKSVPGRKLDKSRFSILLGANADGSHKVKPVVVGKSARPRVLKDCMNQLPCHYFSSQKAWFTSDIFRQVFRKVIAPSIEEFQVRELKLAPERVRAVILLDNAPAHPSTDELVALGGRIRCLFLPPNTTSLIQPMDQGVIQATKMRYRRHFLRDVLVVSLGPEDEVEDTRGQRTLENLRRYNIKSAIFNVSSAWKEISQATLANAWNPLLRGVEETQDFVGFSVQDFTSKFHSAGETGPSDADVEDWLISDEGDPGYAMLSTQEIAASVLTDDPAGDDGDDEGEASVQPQVSYRDARSALDLLLEFIDERGKNFSEFYTNVREFRTRVISCQYEQLSQTKIDSFFQVRSPSSCSETERSFTTPSPTSTSTSFPMPSTSGTSGTTTFRPIYPPPPSFGSQSDSD